MLNRCKLGDVCGPEIGMTKTHLAHGGVLCLWQITTSHSEFQLLSTFTEAQFLQLTANSASCPCTSQELYRASGWALRRNAFGQATVFLGEGKRFAQNFKLHNSAKVMVSLPQIGGQCCEAHRQAKIFATHLSKSTQKQSFKYFCTVLPSHILRISRVVASTRCLLYEEWRCMWLLELHISGIIPIIYHLSHVYDYLNIVQVYLTSDTVIQKSIDVYSCFSQKVWRDATSWPARCIRCRVVACRTSMMTLGETTEGLEAREKDQND